MNSKLRKLDKILHAMAKHYEAVALSRTPPNKTDFANAEKAIRQAVAEDMLELVEHPHQILIQIDDIEYLNGGYVSRVELREKIKEWSQS